MKKYFELFTIGFYILFLSAILVTMQQIWFPDLLKSEHFLNWDAEHYEFIKQNGFESYRVAFFPLFPLIWKFLALGTYGAVLLNSIVFLMSFYLIVRKLKIKNSLEIVLYLTIPSFIFFYLPYSESIFFLCSTAILFGIKDKKYYLIYIGLFFAILARPAFTVFIPALIITEFFSEFRTKTWLRISIYIGISLVGVLLVTFIQFLDTGEWFKFFEAQKHWGNFLQIPSLPLTSWAGGFIVRLDGFAFLIGIISGGFLLGLIFKLKQFRNTIIPSEVIFSLAYLGGITLIVLLFRGGSLFSLNRFIFATPFIIVAFNFWIKSDFCITKKQLFSIFGLIFIFWLLFGSYVHIQLMLKYLLVTFYAILIFTVKSEFQLIRKLSLYALIFLGFTFQVVLFIRFLNGNWVA
jgi:hypothetical protein